MSSSSAARNAPPIVERIYEKDPGACAHAVTFLLNRPPATNKKAAGPVPEPDDRDPRGDTDNVSRTAVRTL